MTDGTVQLWELLIIGSGTFAVLFGLFCIWKAGQ